jgi:hypothetical protein
MEVDQSRQKNLPRQINNLPGQEAPHGLFVGEKCKDATLPHSQGMSRKRYSRRFDGNYPFRADQQIDFYGLDALISGGIHGLIQPDSAAPDNLSGLSAHVKIALFRHHLPFSGRGTPK